MAGVFYEFSGVLRPQNCSSMVVSIPRARFHASLRSMFLVVGSPAWIRRCLPCLCPSEGLFECQDLLRWGRGVCRFHSEIAPCSPIVRGHRKPEQGISSSLSGLSGDMRSWAQRGSQRPAEHHEDRPTPGRLSQSPTAMAGPHSFLSQGTPALSRRRTASLFIRSFGGEGARGCRSVPAQWLGLSSSGMGIWMFRTLFMVSCLVCKATELFFCCCVDSSGAFPCQSAFNISCGGSSRVNQALVVLPAFSQDFFHCRDLLGWRNGVFWFHRHFRLYSRPPLAGVGIKGGQQQKQT